MYIRAILQLLLILQIPHLDYRGITVSIMNIALAMNEAQNKYKQINQIMKWIREALYLTVWKKNTACELSIECHHKQTSKLNHEN